MIDHMQTTNINVLGRLRTNEFSCRLATQTRRFSCISQLEFNKTHGQINGFKSNRQSISNFDEILKKKGLKREQSTAPSVVTPKYVVKSISSSIRAYIEDKARLTNCQRVHICDGSVVEREQLLRLMSDQNIITPLKKYENCWLARTDPRDVARVESKTFICTRNKHDVVPRGTEGAPSVLGNWMNIDELDNRMSTTLKNCMTGRTMYVIPFSMGPIGSNLSKVGIQLTDSPYVVASMLIMTRVSSQVLQLINSQENEDYVRCFHSVGCPLPLEKPIINNWPCNPDETIISHIPERKEIISYGSGYGGNSLLGKKCFALRLGSILGRNEGWLAEHMLILGITDPRGVKKYIVAAFPSACGKTNLAMMTPTLPGYKVECVGDDIAWMRFDNDGVLRAINPEAGFFGVAPGTNDMSNPNAMKTIQKNTIFTNVAETSDGDFYWEGLELKSDTSVKDWQNKEWQPNSGTNAAHPNSRFCAPASQCPIIDPLWESSEGVPISAIIFGGRRPEGVPLVYESFDWCHGVFVGASMRSESTAAAEHKAKVIMHDPFAMRPFFGYNFGQYLDHWLSFGKRQNLQLPKIFHVNWFRKDIKSGKFLWPGFGENSRVLDWICRRVDGEDIASSTPIGLVPKEGTINLEGLKDNPDMSQLFSISTDFWLQEQETIENYLTTNVGQDLPKEIKGENVSNEEDLIVRPPPPPSYHQQQPELKCSKDHQEPHFMIQQHKVNADEQYSDKWLDDFWPVMNHVEEKDDGSMNNDLILDGGDQDHDDNDHQHDPGYEIVNHRYWVDDMGTEPQVGKKHQNDRKHSWWNWKNVISHFPRARKEQLKQYQNLDKSSHSKGHIQNNFGKGIVQSREPSLPVVPVTTQQQQQEITPATKDINDHQVKEDPLKMIVLLKKEEYKSEMDQQDQMQLIGPVMIDADDQAVKMQRLLDDDYQQQQDKQQGVVNQIQQEDITKQAADSTSFKALPSSASQRVRASLSNAADIARNLSLRASNLTSATVGLQNVTQLGLNAASAVANISSDTFEGPLEAFVSPDNTRQVWSVDQSSRIDSRSISALPLDPMLSLRRWRTETADTNSRLHPKYLGFGQLQKNDPFNGNGRTTARLSCQFGNSTMSNNNMSISNVEWAKFNGDYDLKKQEPDFECQRKSCRLAPVRTDVFITVHPRPPVQHYTANTVAPSYSMTIHEVEDRHRGVYRCSALRKLEQGNTELVYRIIAFE